MSDIHTMGLQSTIRALESEVKSLKEKANKYDEVEFLVIEINGKPDDIVHLHGLLEDKKKLDAIKDILKVPLKQGAVPTIRKIRTILDSNIESDKIRTEGN